MPLPSSTLTLALQARNHITKPWSQASWSAVHLLYAQASTQDPQVLSSRRLTWEAPSEALELPQLLSQDPAQQPGNQEQWAGSVGPVGAHQGVGRQREATWGPEAPSGGGLCGVGI